MKVVNNHPLINFYYPNLYQVQDHNHYSPMGGIYLSVLPLKTVPGTAHEPEMPLWHNVNMLVKNDNSKAYMGI
jgi:hypothetical protein